MTDEPLEEKKRWIELLYGHCVTEIKYDNNGNKVGERIIEPGSDEYNETMEKVWREKK